MISTAISNLILLQPLGPLFLPKLPDTCTINFTQIGRLFPPNMESIRIQQTSMSDSHLMPLKTRFEPGLNMF